LLLAEMCRKDLQWTVCDLPVS